MNRQAEVDAYLAKRLQHPDRVGQSEYRLVYDFVRDLLLERAGTQNILAALNEIDSSVVVIRRGISA